MTPAGPVPTKPVNAAAGFSLGPEKVVVAEVQNKSWRDGLATALALTLRSDAVGGHGLFVLAAAVIRMDAEADSGPFTEEIARRFQQAARDLVATEIEIRAILGEGLGPKGVTP